MHRKETPDTEIYTQKVSNTINLQTDMDVKEIQLRNSACLNVNVRNVYNTSANNKKENTMKCYFYR